MGIIALIVINTIIDESNLMNRFHYVIECLIFWYLLRGLGVQHARSENYVDLVKKVGLELRSLLSSVDHLIPSFPLATHREVEMAHKVLSKDMAELVSALKLAEKYSSTTLDNEYRKGMLSAAHILAMNAKNLLDVIDSVRMKHPNVNVLFNAAKSWEADT